MRLRLVWEWTPGVAARWAGRACLLLALLALAAGCSGKRHAARHYEVSGRVLFKGKPLPGGRIVFVTTDGFAANADIDENGNYKIEAPAGDARISVDNRMLRKGSPLGKEYASKGAGRPDAPPPSPVKGTYVAIPSKYYTPDTSGLTYTVTTTSPQTHDIEIKDERQPAG